MGIGELRSQARPLPWNWYVLKRDDKSIRGCDTPSPGREQFVVFNTCLTTPAAPPPPRTSANQPALRNLIHGPFAASPSYRFLISGLLSVTRRTDILASICRAVLSPCGFSTPISLPLNSANQFDYFNFARGLASRCCLDHASEANACSKRLSLGSSRRNAASKKTFSGIISPSGHLCNDYVFNRSRRGMS